MLSMLRLSNLKLICNKTELGQLPEGKVLVNTINAHSYNMAQKDEAFAEALSTIENGNRKNENETGCVKFLIPDGASIVKACRWLKAESQPKERLAGWDLFAFEMQRLNEKGERRDGKWRVMFMGSSEKVLEKIRLRMAKDYPHLEVVTFSPPYKPVFLEEDDAAIIKAINEATPDLLWIGMTAPKQEKWAFQHWGELNIHCHVGTIGAVFDFYAGTMKRAPQWWQDHSLEWFYRFILEPRRMWRRYVIGNPLFLWNVMKEYVHIHKKRL